MSGQLVLDEGKIVKNKRPRSSTWSGAFFSYGIVCLGGIDWWLAASARPAPPNQVYSDLGAVE